jgi:hypothetical protein
MESLDRWLTVTAGAGFGKSTLLAAWGQRLGCTSRRPEHTDPTLILL